MRVVDTCPGRSNKSTRFFANSDLFMSLTAASSAFSSASAVMTFVPVGVLVESPEASGRAITALAFGILTDGEAV